MWRIILVALTCMPLCAAEFQFRNYLDTTLWVKVQDGSVVWAVMPGRDIVIDSFGPDGDYVIFDLWTTNDSTSFMLGTEWEWDYTRVKCDVFKNGESLDAEVRNERTEYWWLVMGVGVGLHILGFGFLLTVVRRLLNPVGEL